MNLNKSENFRIITPLNVNDAIERLRTVTSSSGGGGKSAMIYSGSVESNSFEITRKTERDVYKSRIPLPPFVSFIPGFLKGEITNGVDGKSIVDVTVQTEKVVKGFNRLIWAFIKYLAVLFVAVSVITLMILFFNEPVWNFDLKSVDRVRIAEGLGVLVGIWIAVSAGLVAFDYLNVAAFTKQYDKIVAFEKNALTNLFEGKLQ